MFPRFCSSLRERQTKKFPLLQGEARVRMGSTDHDNSPHSHPAPDVSSVFVVSPLPSRERVGEGGATCEAWPTRERRVACLSSVTMNQYPSLTHRASPRALPQAERGNPGKHQGGLRMGSTVVVRGT
jgi:hypothetical protein